MEADSLRLGQATVINNYHFYVDGIEDGPSAVHTHPNPLITGSTRTGSLCRNPALRSSKVAVQEIYLTIVEPTMALILLMWFGPLLSSKEHTSRSGTIRSSRSGFTDAWITNALCQRPHEVGAICGRCILSSFLHVSSRRNQVID